MTTAEANNERATVEEFRQDLSDAVSDARGAGVSWAAIEALLHAAALEAGDEAAKEAG